MEEKTKIKEEKESSKKQQQEEAIDYKDKYIRLYAEFDNARKRMEREKEEFVKYANEELISEFLNILDDLERTLEAAQSKSKNDEAFLKGVEMVMAHIYEMLKKQGVCAIETEGKRFDPHYHEILLQEETEDSAEGTILEELQKGYLYNNQVIRTAKVKIAKGKENKKQ